jgi:hypothetical protein
MFVLNSDKTWNYLFLAPGSSYNNNPAILRDSNARNYMIYSDTAFNGTKYVNNEGGKKNYLNSFPAITSGNPIDINDAFGKVYTLYSDPDGNKYVTYSDSKGKYYITDKGSKSYLP